MKKFLTISLFLYLTNILFTQTIPVTFHFKPDYTEFQVLRLVGSFNGWTNSDDNLIMTDADEDGEYEITTDLTLGVHNYKFVMDADWGFAYTDPDNPLINLNDNNNSIITVKDPMITYLLPRNINSENEEYIDNSADGVIRAIFAFSQANPIDPSKLSLTIDGVEVANPAQYYNTEKRELLYQPSPALTTGEHTVTLSITSNLGTDSQTSTFIRDPNYVPYKIPVDFYFDQYSTSINFAQNVTQVSAVGGFNNWNPALNIMQDNDKDGLWETTAIITPGSYEYKFKLNDIQWVNDPDNPVFGPSVDLNNLIVIKPDSIPGIKLVQPVEGTIYPDNQNISFQALLKPGIKSLGVQEESIVLKLNGTIISHSFDTTNSTVDASISLESEGRHLVELSYTNEEGLIAAESYSYGIYKGETGKYIVDAYNDEPYSYPTGVPQGSADIIAVTINETPSHDSLKFIIDIEDISDRTRIGLIISGANKNLIADPLDLDIKTLDWNGKGIFASIGTPGNSYENTSVENKIMISNNPVSYSNIKLNINNDASVKNSFEFTLSLADLDGIIGSWTKERLFYVFSFIAAEDKSGKGMEVSPNEGGSAGVEDPDIYDAAFVRSGFWQDRMFANYIPAGEIEGPRHVALDGNGRGILLLTAKEISDSLAKFGPEVTFLTPGVEYWYANVTIHGTLSDSAITSITFHFNNAVSIVPVNNGNFSVPVTLNEGENIVYAEAKDSRGYETVSENLTLTYKPDKLPFVSIDASVEGRKVTLVANATSPTDATFTFTWTADISNPAPVSFSSTANQTVINIPQVEGEYSFTVRARDSKNNRVNAKKIILAKGDSVYAADVNHHSKWIDDAIVYEIYPRAFSQQGGFTGITDGIPQMKELGINTVWLMPVYEGPTTHGYEITDYYGLEKDYGTDSEFKSMLAAFKANGIKVILDYVVNHTSIQHPFMENVFQYKSYSPWADFYIWEGEPGNSNFEYEFTWSTLPNLNHDNPDVRKYFIDAAKYWVSLYGIDGFRCDVAWLVEDRNSLFWQEWREALKNIKPEVFLEAEAGSDNPIFYQKRFDSANDWQLRNKLRDVLKGTVSLQDLHSEVTRSYPSHARPFRFVENHDEVRSAFEFDTKRSVLLHTIIFTLNGIPLIYSGGEVGALTNRDMIDWSDPDNIKPNFLRLTDIRKKYIHNPVIELINNSDNTNVYSYSSISGDNVVLTAANFRNEPKNIDIDLSELPFDGTSDYYLTDLMDGIVYKILPAERNNYPISLSDFQARVFHYGLDSVMVDVKDIADQNIPKEYKLFQNYPNPFNPATKIRYQVIETEKVTLKIFDVLGNEVMTLVDEIKNPGTYETIFNGVNLSSGIYFYQIKAGRYVDTKKLMLLK